MGVDNIKMLEKCVEKAPMIAKVAESLGWAKLWDHALDLGWKAVLGLKMVGRAMSHHRRGGHLCHMCDVTSLKEDSVLDHILIVHHQQLHLNPPLNNLELLDMLSMEILPEFKNISCL